MNTGAAIPPRMMLALIAVVVGMHAWLLQRTPPRVQTAAPARTVAFTIRRVDLPAPSPPAAAPAPGVTRVGAAPRPRADARQQIESAAPGRAGRPAALASAAAPIADLQPGRVAVPGAMHMRYAVTALRRQQLVQGTSELLWDPEDQRYEASFAVSLDGVPPRRQHSAGQLGPAGLAPQRFAEINRGEQATHFERDGGRLIFSNNRPAVPLLAGAQDRLSILIQLSALFAGEPGRYPVGTSIAVQTATTREAQAWVFTVEGGELLQLPAGDMTTVKLVRPPQAQYDQRVEVWLAPGAAYVPVRLRLTQPNGDWVDHQWSATDRR